MVGFGTGDSWGTFDDAPGDPDMADQMYVGTPGLSAFFRFGLFEPRRARWFHNCRLSGRPIYPGQTAMFGIAEYRYRNGHGELVAGFEDAWFYPEELTYAKLKVQLSNGLAQRLKNR